MQSESLEHRPCQAFAVGGTLIAMQLGQCQTTFIHQIADYLHIFVDEHANRKHKGWKSGHNPSDYSWLYKPRTLAIEHESERVRAGLHRRLRVLGIRDPADFNLQTAHHNSNDTLSIPSTELLLCRSRATWEGTGYGQLF